MTLTLGRGIPTMNSLRPFLRSDHRKAYLTYEGPVSGERGRVRRVAEGEVEVLARGLSWRVRLRGGAVAGTFEIG